MANIVELMINLGLGKPAELERFHGDSAFLRGKVLLGAAPDAELLPAVCRNFKAADIKLYTPRDAVAEPEVLAAASAAEVAVESVVCEPESLQLSFKALIFDGSGIADARQLKTAWQFFSPVLRRLDSCGRVLILARPHRQAESAEQAAAQRALEGLSRSIAKEIGRKGATAQLFYVDRGGEDSIDSPLRFVLSPRAAYIDGQVLHVRKAGIPGIDWHHPLAGKTALVTGAARGIGEAIARTLARDGATVLGLDVQGAADALESVMTAIGGEAMVADITAENAPAEIAARLKAMGGADIVVHNAGVTRDKTLANMPEHWWDMTLDINLAAAQRINRALLDGDAINNGGRIVGVSSMNGIAGQRGQSNYATSKAGVIGYVEYMAEELATRKITVNAVAPGFIETLMTASIPLMTREVGRRLNSLSQGGQPIDVAEAIAFLASPASQGVTGNVLRVCGQSWLGA